MPEGETAAEVGRRADRVVERARSVAGDTLAVAHGHLLRVLAARWLGLPPAAGRLFVLDAGALSILSSEHDRPAVLVATLVEPDGDPQAYSDRRRRWRAGSGEDADDDVGVTIPWARSTMSARL